MYNQCVCSCKSRHAGIADSALSRCDKCVDADQLEARSLLVPVCTFANVVLALPCAGTIFSHSL